MALDRQAWLQAVRDGTAPKYHYRGINGAYHLFANALIAHKAFMDYYIASIVDEMIDPNNFSDDLRDAWIKHVERVAEQEAITFDRRTDGEESDRASEIYEELKEQLLNNRDELVEWVRTRVVERWEALEREIRRKVEANDADAETWRQWHPPTGIYCRGKSCVIPLDQLVGFCPKCHEPLTKGAVFPSESSGGYAMQCTSCRVSNGIDQLEDRYGHAFHLMPFTNIPLRDVIAASRQHAQEATALAR